MTEPPMELRNANAASADRSVDALAPGYRLAPAYRKPWKTPHVIASTMAAAGTVTANTSNQDAHTFYSS